MTVDEIRALRLAKRHDEHVIAARAYVADHPEDALAQIEAAYGNDRAGDERTAIIHYEEAYRIGVPADVRRRFLVGFGSTLRNVGRAEDAVNVLAAAVEADPHYPAYAAFLALALADAGHPKAALATLLGCALDAARPDAFDGYERALGEYHTELLERVVSSP
jgi:tetratricopeptide (TPR) repeat protein